MTPTGSDLQRIIYRIHAVRQMFQRHITEEEVGIAIRERISP